MMESDTGVGRENDEMYHRSPDGVGGNADVGTKVAPRVADLR